MATPEPSAEEQAKAKKLEERNSLTKFARDQQLKVDRERRMQEQHRQELAQRDRELAEYKRKAELAERYEKEIADPLEFLSKRGISAKQIGERIVAQGTVDAQLQQVLDRQKKLEEDNEKLRTEARDREHRAAQEQAMLRAKRDLLREYDGIKKDSPLLSRLSEERVLEEYLATYRLAQADPETAGLTFSEREYLQATEARLRADLEEKLGVADTELLESVLTKRKKPASSDESNFDSGSEATGRQSEKASTSASKSLSQAAVGSPSKGWKPDNWSKLSDKEQNTILIDRLRKGLPLD